MSRIRRADEVREESRLGQCVRVRYTSMTDGQVRATACLDLACSSFRHGLDGDIQALRPPNEPTIKGVEGIRLV